MTETGHEAQGAARPRLIAGRLPVVPGSGPGVAWRLAAFYGTAFLLIGLYMPFWPVWLQSRGLDAGEIGVVLALTTWTKVVASPLFAGLADRLGERRRVILGLSLASLASYALYARADTFVTLCAGAIAIGMFFPAQMPLVENMTMLAARVRGFDYGRVRLWGSLTFIAGAYGGGLWLAGRPESQVSALVVAVAVLAVLAAAALPEVRVARAPRAGAGLLRLLGDRRFALFLAAASLIQASHAAYYGFATLHWRAAGLHEATIGLLWAEGVIAEIVLFAFAAPVVRRIGIVPLFALAALAGVVRWSALAASSELWLLVLVQGLHAGTFGAAHLAAMHFVQQAVPAASSARAQALYSAVAAGVAMALAMAAAGMLYAWAGAGAFLAMAAMAAAGGGAALVLGRLWQGEEIAPTAG